MTVGGVARNRTGVSQLPSRLAMEGWLGATPPKNHGWVLPQRLHTVERVSRSLAWDYLRLSINSALQVLNILGGHDGLVPEWIQVSRSLDHPRLRSSTRNQTAGEFPDGLDLGLHLRRGTAAPLELPARPAGTRVVAPDLT